MLLHDRSGFIVPQHMTVTSQPIELNLLSVHRCLLQSHIDWSLDERFGLRQSPNVQRMLII